MSDWMLSDAEIPIYERICRWMKRNYPPANQADHQFALANPACANPTALSYLRANFAVGDGWHYQSHDVQPCDLISPVLRYVDDLPVTRTGALRFRFQHEDGRTFDVLLVTILLFDDDFNSTVHAVASVPREHSAHWLALEKECRRIDNSALPYRGKVYVIGGQESSFDTSVRWDEIYLPQNLKDDILRDVDAFFQKGVSIYQRLNIRPFRKLLLAGVPGTGKTMICSALAHWALQRKYFVVYVSGANTYGAKFWKVHQALDMAASSESPTLVIVEELDAYLEDDSKAELLNVLDGSESPINNHGTIMIATTNHPEKIDDRVMKRPGRLDRIFVIPEMESQESTEAMLRKYMGEHWRDDHATIVPQLLGKPGAFIREVALYALTMAAYNDSLDVSLELLQQSLHTLTQQIEAKDDFLTARKRSEMGLLSERRRALPF
ncbi:MAG: ATP-binding protein [Anaerolineae bacterium]|nr:ATP-binding protein [Anaerolineae bacterium]